MIDILIQAVRPVADPSDLSYVGVETVDGRELHHLTANGMIAYRPAAGGTGNLDAFDIWVEEDRTPVLAKATLSATDPEAAGRRGFCCSASFRRLKPLSQPLSASR